MGIYKRGELWYADYYKYGKRVRVSLDTTDKEEARGKYRALLKSGEGAREGHKGVSMLAWMEYPNIPQFVAPGSNTAGSGTPSWARIPFDEFLARFNDYTATERAAETQYRFKIAVEYLKKSGNIRYLSDITPITLEKYKKWLINQGKKPGNLNRLLQAIKTMMRTAEKWKLVPMQNWNLVSKMKQKKGRVVFHTEEEIQEMLKVAPQWYRLIIKLGSRAGLRRGEMAELRWEDIDFEHNQIYVRANKTENYRYVPLSQDLKTELENFPRGKDGYVVPLLDDCKRECRYFITAAYCKMMKVLGFKSFPHKLRHTFASHLVQKGVELYTVSKLLGHSSIKMTEIYAHLAPRTLQDAIRALP